MTIFASTATCSASFARTREVGLLDKQAVDAPYAGVEWLSRCGCCAT